MDLPSPPSALGYESRRDATPRSSTSSTRPKRRKIQVACRNCRNSKTRCDGDKPVCSACDKRGLLGSCIYERAQFTGLRDVRNQEHRMQRQERVQTANQTSFVANDHTIDHAITLSDQNRPLRSRRLSAPRLSHMKASQGMSLDSHDSYQVDALATVNSAEVDDCLYGGSSTIAFVQQFAESEKAGETAVPIQHEHSPAVWNAVQLDSRFSVPNPEIILERNENASVYPARRKADDYLHCFWEFIHPVFPVIHKTSFVAKYEKLWISGDSAQQAGIDTDVDEVVFTSNLNLIFALGCQFSTLIPAAQKRSAANEFYQRSRHLFLFDILDSKSISLVQMLLLTGIYLQSTPHATRCWNSIGLAIRIAQCQGLHLDYTGRRSETQLACQMRRRVWHTCVMLDTLLAMTFGRPTMLSNSWNVPGPLLVDDEYLSVQGDGTQPPDVPSRLGLFVSSCKLFEILHEILLNFYAQDSGIGNLKHLPSENYAREILGDVLSYNRRLDMFKDSIPEYLRTVGTSHITISEKNSCVNLQQQVLYCRFLYTKLLSLRPLLLSATKRERQSALQSSRPDKLPSSLDAELIRHCCNTCLVTAHDLVETIHQHLDTAYKSSGWHSVYFTFAAATILLAGWKCQEVDSEICEKSFQTCWNQCLSILDHYKEQIHSAPRAIQALKTLRSQVMVVQNQDIHVRDDAMDSDQSPIDLSLNLDFSQFNAYGADCLTDAWFGQQLLNLDWMDFPQLPE